MHCHVAIVFVAVGRGGGLFFGDGYNLLILVCFDYLGIKCKTGIADVIQQS